MAPSYVGWVSACFWRVTRREKPRYRDVGIDNGADQARFRASETAASTSAGLIPFLFSRFETVFLVRSNSRNVMYCLTASRRYSLTVRCSALACCWIARSNPGGTEKAMILVVRMIHVLSLNEVYSV